MLLTQVPVPLSIDFFNGTRVRIKPKAKPAGWGSDRLSKSVATLRGNELPITDVFVEADRTITVEVGGWYWNINDLERVS